MTPEEIVARLIYRDGLMLVIDKPPGLAVHKGPKGGESLEDYFGALRFGLPRPPALAHRLDRDTSGCLVLGRHRKALAALGRLFKSGQVGKTYFAVVAGGPPQDEGRIELPLGRKDATGGWWMKDDPWGQPAVTTWKVMGRTRFPSTGGDERFPHLACARAAHRSHPSTARALRCHGMADRRRPRLWRRPVDGHSQPQSARTRDRGAALQESRADPRHRARAAAHAATAARVRMAGRSARAMIAMSRLRGARCAQYSVAFKRSGAARSWASPPSLPSVNSARIVPLLGRPLRSTWRDGSHSFERTIAFAH